MSTFLQRILGHVPDMDDERYWVSRYNPPSVSGVAVNADAALKIATAWACIRLISETIASLPKFVYERLADDGRARAPGHPLYDIVHSSPNSQQTAFEFFEMMTGHALLRGNAYARILPGQRGFVDELVPLHPDRVKVEKLPDGGHRYTVSGSDGMITPVNSEDMLVLRGMSGDGVSGLDPIAYASNSLGLTLAAEMYGARFFKNDARPSVVLKHPTRLKEQTAERLRNSWNALHGGSGVHGTAVLEEGMDLVTVGIDPRNAQFLELRDFQAEDVCRWFRVPPHMVGLTSKATTWGSGIEQLSIGFVVYTLMPWIVRWQQAITRSLILAPNKYFVEFDVNGLLRGDFKTRMEGYAIGREIGLYSPNEMRKLENMNPRTDPGGDVYEREALTVMDDNAGANARSQGHYQALLYESAARVVRKEIAALSKAGRRASGDEWSVAVHNFYSDHAALVAQALRISLEDAARYCAGGEGELLTAGPAALDQWEARRIGELVRIATEAQ